MANIVKKFLGDPQVKKLKVLTKQVDSINKFEDDLKKKSEAELKELAANWKKKLTDDPKKLDQALPEVFALVREGSVRALGMRPFDVQLIGGMALHQGNVAEMRTGEGKTLVATLPSSLNAMTGRGVHVVTVNDYLAQRDAGWMGLLYDFLGLSVSVIIAEKSYIYDAEFENEEHDDERLIHLKPCSRREAYEADITYGTNNEFGFDYLRDNMVRNSEHVLPGGLNIFVVDNTI